MTSRIRSVAAISCAAVLSCTTLAGVNYSLVGSFTLADGLASVDSLADGRLIGVRADGALLAQTSVNSSSWAQVGAIDAALLNSFGPSFLAVTPDGSRIAIGDGNFGAGASILVFDTASLNPMSVSGVTSIALGSYTGSWLNNSSLLVSGGDANGAYVAELDAGVFTTRLLVNDVGGASGGISTDGTTLYTGNGFDFDTKGGSETGEVRGFDLAALLAGAEPESFETTGIPVADALSAGSLAIDSLGNLIIGGSDFFSGGESGFFAVVGADLLADALAGGGIVPNSLEAMLDPSNGSANGYFVLFNDATNEAIAVADGVAYRYTVPTPGALGVFGFAGTLCARRRVRASR
jgi:hypothetical protein